MDRYDDEEPEDIFLPVSLDMDAIGYGARNNFAMEAQIRKNRIQKLEIAALSLVSNSSTFLYFSDFIIKLARGSGSRIYVTIYSAKETRNVLDERSWEFPFPKETIEEVTYRVAPKEMLRYYEDKI